MSVWGLVDDRTGHTGQVLGIIAKLGLPYHLKRLEYNWLVHVPFLSASFITLDRARSAPLDPPWPKLVVAAGRRTVPILRAIKKKSPSTVTVYAMWPGSPRGIDLIAAPEHDAPPDAPNIIRTLAPLHAVTPETLAATRMTWSKEFEKLPRPLVAVMIGGNTKHGAYSEADWRALIAQAHKLAGNGSLLITTSRRTPANALPVIEPLLAGPHYLHRFDTAKDNPYLGMIGTADAIVVTGDSLSMCAEACVAGSPVYIFAPAHAMPEKHRRLHQALYAREHARPLTDQATLDWRPKAPLDEAAMIADAIKQRFPQVIL